jgi:hypothetical protein
MLAGGSQRAGADSPTAGSKLQSAQPAFAWHPAAQGTAAHTSALALRSRCGRAPGAGSYSWPVKPFGQQHPIRGFFGDPRTVFRSATSANAGTFSFHNGVDIVAADGTPVYPVASGIVTKVKLDEIVVDSAKSKRTFQYWHLVPLVWIHEHVTTGDTVLGTVRRGRGHVHLTELDGNLVVNPLQPGHLTPYVDTTAPTVGRLSITDLQGRPLDPLALRGTVELTATAADTPPMPLPQPWTGVPLAPATLSWRISTLRGQAPLPTQTPADFARTIPQPSEFRSVYAEGTYQNFPAAGTHYFYGTPGNYLFNLTPSPLDTRLLHSGSYTLTVTATDTCGNRGSLRENIRILPQRDLTPLSVTMQTQRAATASPLVPRRFWTVVLATLAVPLRPSPRNAFLAAVHALGLVTAPEGRDLLITGRFRTWTAAYTAAERNALRFPGAYARQIVGLTASARNTRGYSAPTGGRNAAAELRSREGGPILRARLDERVQADALRAAVGHGLHKAGQRG